MIASWFYTISLYFSIRSQNVVNKSFINLQNFGTFSFQVKESTGACAFRAQLSSVLSVFIFKAQTTRLIMILKWFH